MAQMQEYHALISSENVRNFRHETRDDVIYVLGGITVSVLSMFAVAFGLRGLLDTKLRTTSSEDNNEFRVKP